MNRPSHKEISRKIKQAKVNERSKDGLPERAWKNGDETNKKVNNFSWYSFDCSDKPVCVQGLR